MKLFIAPVINFILCLLGFSSVLHARQPTFKAQAPLVVIPLTVSDKHGAPLYGLTETDFRLLDQRQPKPFHLDPPSEYDPGISAVIVIQTSGLSGSALAKIKKTGSMVNGYITGEGSDAAVITADNQIHLAQSFTLDTDLIESAFRTLAAGAPDAGRTLDGVNKALDILSRKPTNRRRRIIVLISETRDRGSKANLKDVLQRAQKENVTIWTISYSAYVTPFTTSAADWQDQGGDRSLNLLAAITEPSRLAKANISTDLARYTGGQHLSFARLKSLENDLATIGKQVHTQYILSFVPSSVLPDLHTISIELNGHPGALLRYRPVYWRVAP